MNELAPQTPIITTSFISNKIMNIRNLQVLLDKDLAELYQVDPRRLREQVKRNISRFPDDFMFQLTETELNFVVSQNASPQKRVFGGALPYVFTEQGVASLSGVLTSNRAIEVNILIMRAFVAMRHFLFENRELLLRLEQIERKHFQLEEMVVNKFDKIFNVIQNKQLPKQGIYFDGQIFDAYLFANDLIKSAKSSIILIDNYIDESVLLLLSKRNNNISAKIFTNNKSNTLQLDLEKYNQQYPKIEILEFHNAHDRFLIIDKSKLYLIGASLKDLGKKWFGFSLIEDDMFLRDILKRLK